LQQLDRVAPLGRGLPNSVIHTRRVGARGLPAGSSRLRRLALRARGAWAVLPSSAVATRFGPRRGGPLGRGGGAFVTRVHDDPLGSPTRKRAQRGRFETTRHDESAGAFTSTGSTPQRRARRSLCCAAGISS